MKKLFNFDDYILQEISKEKFNINARGFGFERCNPLRKPSVFDKFGYYSLHYVISGKGYVKFSEDSIVEVNAGEVFILSYKSKAITYYADKNDPWTYVWVNFSGNNIPQVLNSIDINNDNIIVKVKDRKSFENLSNKMLIDCNKGDTLTPLLLNYYCHALIYELLKNRKSISRENHFENISHIQKAIKFIEQNYSNPELRIEDVSEHCALNKIYFSRLFSKEIGVPFSKYLIDYRLEKASELFRLGQSSIKYVAYSVGFSSPYYFSKVYKKEHSVSPKHFVNEVSTFAKTISNNDKSGKDN